MIFAIAGWPANDSNEPAEPITVTGSAGFLLGLGQIDMDIIVIDILLAFIRCVDVGFRVFNEVAPFNTADVGEFAPPDGGTGIANTLVSGFSVEHILPDDGKSVVRMMCCATFGAAILLLQEIGIGAVCVRENNGQHSIGVTGVGVAILVLTLGGTQGEGDLPRNPLVLFLYPGDLHTGGDEHDSHGAVKNSVPKFRPNGFLLQLRKVLTAGFAFVNVAGTIKIAFQLINVISNGGIPLTGEIGNLVISVLIRYKNFMSHKLSSNK